MIFRDTEHINNSRYSTAIPVKLIGVVLLERNKPKKFYLSKEFRRLSLCPDTWEPPQREN